MDCLDQCSTSAEAVACPTNAHRFSVIALIICVKTIDPVTFLRIMVDLINDPHIIADIAYRQLWTKKLYSILPLYVQCMIRVVLGTATSHYNSHDTSNRDHTNPPLTSSTSLSLHTENEEPYLSGQAGHDGDSRPVCQCH